MSKRANKKGCCMKHFSKHVSIKSFSFAALLALLVIVAPEANAGTPPPPPGPTNLTNVVANTLFSMQFLPGLMSAIVYILGLSLGVFGVLQLKAHVENPSQKPLKDALIRLFAGGAFLALPMLIESVSTAFGNNGLGPSTKKLSGLLDASDFDVAFITAIAGSGLEVNEVVDRLVESLSNTPALISAIAYVFALFLAITGVLKVKEHVVMPQQTPITGGLGRLFIAGALFSLPMLIESAQNLFGDDSLDVEVGAASSLTTVATGIGGAISSLGGIVPDFNHVMAAFLKSVDKLPGIVAILAYILAFVLTVLGAAKLKNHIENPTQVPLKEGVINIVVAGALFALPTIYNIMFGAVGGAAAGGLLAGLAGVFGALDMFTSTYAGTVCNPIDSAADTVASVIGIGSGSSFGGLICGIVGHTGAAPAFINGIAYLMGVIFGFWGIFKIRDHVLNPMQVRLHEGVTRLVAGGFFFAFPFIVETVKSTIGATYISTLALNPVTGYNDGTADLLGSILGSVFGGLFGGGSGGGTATCSGGGGGLGSIISSIIGSGGGSGGGSSTSGLDCLLFLFVNDIMGPIHVLLNFFAFVAGSILIFIGISRLIRSAQDGPRGPGGIGTIMTFVVGGALVSYNEVVYASSSTIFGDPVTKTNAVLNYASGLSGTEVDHANVVITSVLKFVILIGLISFVRGLFIIRSVAEGNQQASMMAGVTHIVAGSVAVNLGPLINAVQTTLGITAYGITFS